LKEQTGIETVIYLKEIMDRAVLVKYKYIPSLDRDDPDYEQWKADLASKGHRWRLKNTQITIRKVSSGTRKGEYLFTPETVARAKEWYGRVKHLPYVKDLEEARQGAGYRQPWIEKVLPTWMRDQFLGFA